MIDHVTQLHDAQTKKKVDEEEALTTTTTKEKVASVQDEAYAKVMDDTIVCGVIIDLTNTATMKETPKVSNAAIADEVVHHIQEPVSKQSATSNEATSREKGEPNVVIVYLISLRLAPLNYELATIVTRDQVKDMIG